MIGKIVIADVETIIYSPVEKTSQSGLFTNKRLALLSLPQASIGYLSKVPEPLTTLQDVTWMNKCKQIVRMKQIFNFNYKIDPKNPSVLQLSWVAQLKQRKWEFKYQNQQVAYQWMRYIQLSLEPPKPKQQQPQLDFSKIQSPKSRFKDYYFPKIKQVSNNNPTTETVYQNSYSSPTKDMPVKQQPKIYQQQNQQQSQDGFTGRFRKFEQNNILLQREDTMPIITTFSQKFSNHNVFNSFGNNKKAPQETFNWNIKWYEEIQSQSQEICLHTYSLFVQFCKQTAAQIVKQITYQKRMRRFIPAKINNHQQIYYIEQVTFKLIVPYLANSDLVYLTTNQSLLKQYEQELQNNRLILKATRNKGSVKVPLTCIVRYLGFIFYCEATPPSNYKQVQDSAMYLFQKHLQKLQQKISLSLSQIKMRLFTNRPEGPPQRPTKSCYLILYNLKYMSPKLKMSQNLFYYLPTQYFLYCEQKVNFRQQNKILKNIEQFSQKFLHSQEKVTCRIISNEDLFLSLRNHMLDKSLIIWLSNRCKSKHLHSVLVTEMFAQYFLLFVWMSMAEYLKDQNVEPHQIAQFEHQVSRMLGELVIPQGQSWEIISDWLFAMHQITLKPQNIIIGYLFSSLSQKIGIQLDYQLLLSQKSNYFSSRFVLSQKVVISYFSTITKHENSDISPNYDQIQQKLFQAVPQQHNLKQVIAFYTLSSGRPNLQAYNMRALCRFLSFFIAIEEQKGFEHLKIYEALTLGYIDINVFQILVSAIKWFLLYENQKEVLEIINYFNQISGFWVGERNPFQIVLCRLMGEYYSQKRNLEKAINYLTISNESAQKLLQGDSNIEQLDADYKLAYLFLDCNKHKEALQKFKKVKKTIQKQNKESLVILDLMVQIAKLYLHLGAVDKCLYYAKQSIKFATLFPFKSEQQQFIAYELILKSLQIQGDNQKMKFYIDLIEDKFAETSNSWILKEVLKLTVTKIALSTTPYHLKKFAFFMHEIEAQLQLDQAYKSDNQKFKALRDYCGNVKYSDHLRESIEKCPEIMDELVLIQSQTKSSMSQRREMWLNQSKKLQLFCQFIGFEYILGQIVSKLNQQDLF